MVLLASSYGAFVFFFFNCFSLCFFLFQQEFQATGFVGFLLLVE
jgi:hypothetical protein